MVGAALTEGVVGRAIEKKVLDVSIHDLRDFTTDRHRSVDDVPYGGGPGMVMKPEPIFKALDTIEAERGGGALAALVVLDAVARYLPGVVGDDQSVAEDSFSRGLLDFPHYTRPAEVGAERVPDVLLSGNHAEIRRWRKRESLARTLARRPDLLENATPDEEERA